MPKITYVRANVSDIDSFFPFFANSIHELFPEYTAKTREYFIEKDYHLDWMIQVVKTGDKILFVAKVESNYAGYLLINKVYGVVSVASWLAVDPKYQHQGIATTLIKMWEDYCSKNGGHSLQLWTTDGNVCFYEKRGFINGGNYKAAWFGVDMPIMYKSLRTAEEKNYLHNYLTQTT